MNKDDADDQLVDLQTRLAFQEETLAQLNDILTEQQRQIDKVRLEFQLIQERYQELLDIIETGPAADEKPPHY